MKILYGIQGTGNGHISRAKAILPALSKIGAIDILISGHSTEVDINHNIKYRFKGIGFSFGKSGGIDYFDSILNFKPNVFISDLQKLRVDGYDLIISDFEPATAWAAKIAGKECLGLSHQASFCSSKTPRPAEKSLLGELILKRYAPISFPIGFHFQNYDDFIYTPVIRDEIRNLECSTGKHITVYLPAYDHHYVADILNQLNVPFHIFSKHASEIVKNGNCHIFPICGDRYVQSLKESKGVVCGAGFESPSEVLYLGKKLLCIPMKDQYEQLCNAAALEQMGVDILYSLTTDSILDIHKWLDSKLPIKIDYEHITDTIVDRIAETQSFAN